MDLNVFADQIVRAYSSILVLVVDKPESLRVEAAIAPSFLAITISCDRNDKKHLIGKAGVFAEALRTIAKTACGKRRIKTAVVISDE